MQVNNSKDKYRLYINRRETDEYNGGKLCGWLSNNYGITQHFIDS